jgi:hypothetical protein
MDEGGPKEKVERVENTPDAFPLEKKGWTIFHCCRRRRQKKIKKFVQYIQISDSL